MNVGGICMAPLSLASDRAEPVLNLPLTAGAPSTQ